MNKTELLNEAKKATSLEELTQMAADAGLSLTEEEVKFYFSLTNQKEGELSLEELDAAVGGAGDGEDRESLAHCKHWRCYYCWSSASGKERCDCVPKGVSTVLIVWIVPPRICMPNVQSMKMMAQAAGE